MRILVSTYLTAGDRIALAAVRALHKAHYDVVLGSDRLSSPSFWSRYCGARVRLPSPVLAPDDYAQAVLEQVSINKLDTVLPADDYAVHALARSVTRQNWPVALPVPALDTYLAGHDKCVAMRSATAMGVRIPQTALVRTLNEALLALADFSFPVVVKLSRGNGAVGLGIASSVEAVKSYFESVEDYSDAVFDFSRFLLQEYIPGETHDLCALFRRGEPRATLTSRRLITFPLTGGAGIYNETTARTDVREAGLKILRSLRWHGPAQVEFKIDSRDGVPVLIDLNGRLWGTLGLSTYAGINFPALTCLMAVEGDIPAQPACPPGIRYRWPLPHGLRCLLEKPANWKALQRLFRPFTKEGSDFEILDPGPAMAMILSGEWLPITRHTGLSPLAILAEDRAWDSQA